jgi:hypothetical protein
MMTYINWDETFLADPSTGEVVPSGTEGALELPTYGNYGGGGYSAGEPGGDPPTTLSGGPLTLDQLTQQGIENRIPVDALDYLYYRHDVASSDVGEPYTQEQAQADAALINALILFDASSDPEASLYAGGSTLAMLGRLAINDQLDLLPPAVLVAAAKDAVGDIHHALENLPQQELVAALDLLFDQTSEGVFEFDFEVTTTSLEQEFIERIAVNALNDVLDDGEADDAPVDTGFPVSGVSEYQVTFDIATRDLDFLSV